MRIVEQIAKTNLKLVGIIISLIIISLTMIFSITNGLSSGMFTKQLIFLMIGIALFVGISLFKLNFIKSIVVPAGVVILILLVLVLFVGHSALGAQRWIDLGLFKLQPSEFAKVIFILILGLIFSFKTELRTFALAGFITIAAFGLIMAQPDLGTGLVFLFLFVGTVMWSGFNGKYLAFIIIPVICGILAILNIYYVVATLLIVALGHYFIFKFKEKAFFAILLTVSIMAGGIGIFAWNNVLHDYQKNRVITFINPELDKQGQGYHINQSKIAIGHGGILGEGLGQGSQTQLHFVPEQHTDFIFSAVGEELGFIGTVIVVLLYLALMFVAIDIAANAKDKFDNIVAGGIAIYFGVQSTINMGMVMGLLPVVGVPLPLISAGGSSVIASMIALGILNNIHIKSKSFI